MGVKLGFSH